MVFRELHRHYWSHSLEPKLFSMCYPKHWESYVPSTHSDSCFDCIGVDVIQFPQSWDENQYAAVFVDYQVAQSVRYPRPTLAKLLVKEVVSRCGVPAELLSDPRAAFMSGLMDEVQGLLGYHQVNTIHRLMASSSDLIAL